MQTLETQRLLLRPLTPEDGSQVFALTGDPRVARFMRFSIHTCREQAEALIRDYTAGDSLGFGVMERDGGDFIGVFALKPEDGSPGTRSMSLFLDPKVWNRGYAGEICLAAEQAAPQWGIEALRAYVVGSNAPSRKSLERRGFAVAEVRRFPDLPDGLYIYEKRL